jgi:16S rRNA U516 pseudouridylate synthase RsuA-like enzyme
LLDVTEELNLMQVRTVPWTLRTGRVQVNGLEIKIPQHSVVLREDTIQVDGKVIQGVGP